MPRGKHMDSPGRTIGSLPKLPPFPLDRLRHVAFVGIGGIAEHLLKVVSLMLWALGRNDIVVTLVDGDAYEPLRNRARQTFRTAGPKAPSRADESNALFGDTLR